METQKKLEIALTTVEFRFLANLCWAVEDLVVSEDSPKTTINLFMAQIDMAIAQGISELEMLNFEDADDRLRQMGDSFQDEVHSSRLLITQARNTLNGDDNQEQQATVVDKFRCKMVSGMYACRKKRDSYSSRLNELLG